MEPQQQSKKPCKPKVCRAFLVLAERTGGFGDLPPTFAHSQKKPYFRSCGSLKMCQCKV